MYRACDDTDHFNFSPLYSDVVFPWVPTYLMPSVEEFQDGPPPVLSLGSEYDTRAVKDFLLLLLE